jgi:peptide/nickel transport system permease protein
MTDITQLPPETGPSLDLHGKNIAVAGQWRLFWLKFKKHKIALASLVVITFMYLVAAFADFIAPFDPNATNARFTYAPPQGISLLLDGSFRRMSVS